jgi:tocopherol O-methyltransferase
MNTHLQDVREYYESTRGEYRVFWTGPSDLAMHFGYYDDTVKNHVASLIKLNEVLATYARIKAKDSVLDAGCGFGGSSIWLARTIGCSVRGITIVPSQIAKAQKYALKYRVSDRVSFSLEDFCHTSFADESYNIVWALESIVHADSKDAFIKEAARLLKPGGRLVMAEYTLREKPPLSDPEHRSILPWLEGWEMPNLLTAYEYKSLLSKYGFRRMTAYDITEHVKPSLGRLKWFCCLFGTRLVKIGMRLGLFNNRKLENRVATEIAVKAFENGLCNYTIILAEKV